MTALSAREGYRLWAERYEVETAVSHLENRLVSGLGISTSGRAVLDVGCGTGRRIRGIGARLAVGVDASIDMLLAGQGSATVAAGDIRALPIASKSFDVVWCRLVIGHVRDLDGAYRELARVTRDGGTVVVSDMTPESIAAGHRRTFVDESGTARELEHTVHDTNAHRRAAAAASLVLNCQRDGVVGESIREFYISAGRARAYEAQLGLPLVRVFVWHAERA